MNRKAGSHACAAMPAAASACSLSPAAAAGSAPPVPPAAPHSPPPTSSNRSAPPLPADPPRAAARAITDVVRVSIGEPEGAPGLILALQTFGQDLTFHPH